LPTQQKKKKENNDKELKLNTDRETKNHKHNISGVNANRNEDSKTPHPESTKNYNNFIKGFKFSNNELLTGSFVNRNNNDDQKQLKQLVKEKQLDSQVISNLTSELAELQTKSQNFDKILVEYQESSKKALKKEIDNLRITYTVLKEFYNEETIYNKNLINDLSTTIDDILINEKSIRNSKNKKILCNFYLENKDMILGKERGTMNTSLSRFVNAFISESGTASKKMDYLYIQMNKKDNNFEATYGSGLNSKIPSKCPLIKSFRANLSGDLDDLISPSE